MSKPAVLHRRSATLVSVCLCLFVFAGAFSLLIAEDEVLSSVWVSAKALFGSRLPLFAPSHHATDDPTCLSRTQQSLYRNPFRNKPLPPRLLAAWASYTHMHKSCFQYHTWTEAFSRPDSLNDTCKYLVYIEGREGLGNGLLSLTSAFAFALATDRVLLIDSRKNIANLLCEPFTESSWLLPHDFPYKNLQTSPSLGPLMRNNFVASAASLNLQDNFEGQDQQIFCEETYTSLENIKWVAWTSNQYFLTNFFLVPSFWRRIYPILEDDIDHIFTYISRLLLLPANETWAIILREYWSYLSGATSKVGVQIRLHWRSNLAEYDVKANDNIMKCLVEHAFLPSFSERDNNTELSMLHNRKTRARGDESSADIVVLVSSLQEKYAETMKDRFGQTPTKGTKMVRVHSVSQEHTQNKGFHQAQLAFVEMWLLSLSDNLATSAFSTFGYIAQGIGDLHPLILTLKKDDQSCVLGQSVEPCNHYPQAPRGCLGANAKLSEEHKQWIRTHLRRCQDHPRGWQLVHHDVAQHQSNQVAFDFL